jgi:hypothetical protein
MRMAAWGWTCPSLSEPASRTRGAAPGGHLLLRRLGCSGGLLEILQAKLELIGVEPLRAAAELPTLQLPDQQPQLLDLGSRCVMLLANQIALRASCISLGQNSIAFDLERSDPRAFGGDDFSHMPQLL